METDRIDDADDGMCKAPNHDVLDVSNERDDDDHSNRALLPHMWRM